MGTHEGRNVFVDGALPGERVRVKVRREGRVLRGELLAVVAPSPDRRTPACPIWEQCGGCDWLHLQEPAQRAAREKIVRSALEHLGGIGAEDALEERPTRTVEPAMGYRRRATLHAGRGALGFHGRRSHQLVPVDRCPALVTAAQGLPGELGRALLPILRDLSEVILLESGGSWSFSARVRTGLRPRHRTVVEAAVESTGARGAVLLAFRNAPLVIGDPVLREQAPLAPGVTLRLRPDAFAQAHGPANHALAEVVVDLCGLQPRDRLLELYSGNGNLTFALARAVREVVAVESNGVALDLARASADEGSVANVRFVLGDARKVAPGLVRGKERFDVIVADPPRTGARGIDAWADLLGARRVVYVACDPASLARDAREMKKQGFVPRVVQQVDMFPQTHHGETVVSFERAGR